jgi:GAF domain-containing protein
MPTDLSHTIDLRLVTEAMPFPTWLTDAGGMIIHANRRWREDVGPTPSEHSWLDTVSVADRETAVEARLASLRRGEATFSEVRLVGADGRSRWHTMRWIPFHDAHRELIAWTCSWLDKDAERRRADRLRVAAAAGNALAQTPGLHGTIETLAGLIVPDLADWVMISLVDADSVLRVSLAHHREPDCTYACTLLRHTTVHLKESLTAAAAHDGLARVFPDLSPEGVLAEMRAAGFESGILSAMQTLGIGSAAIVPLAHRGATIGIMHLMRSEPGYDERDVPILGDIALAGATAIANAQIFDALLDSEQHLAVVSRASDELARSLSLRETYDTFVRIIVPELADWASITIRDRGGDLRTVSSVHIDPSRHTVAHRMTASIEHVMKTGWPVVTTLVDDGDELGLRSTISVPLVANGECYGALSVGSTSLHRLFTADELPLFEELARRASAAIANARLYEQEHRVATALQAAALPKSLPNGLGLHFSGHYTPGRSELRIGGDWYDAMRLSCGRIMLSIGDVLGTGLEAAITMGNLRQVVRGVAHVSPDPALMLDAADKTLRVDRTDPLVTAFIGILDPVTSSLTYATAGHPPALLRYADGTFAELHTGGLPLGLRERDEATTRTIALLPGSVLVCYTDGLIESTQDILEGERRLRAALESDAALAHDDLARAIHDAVLYDGSHDDVAILTVRMPPPGAPDPFIRWSFDTKNVACAVAARRRVRTLLAERGVDHEACDAAELVVGELVGNVARYASGIADMVMDFSGTWPVVHLLDEGDGFYYLPNSPDVFSERGRGLFIVEKLSRGLSVDARPGGGSHARVVLDVRTRR